jgi:predicted RNase H-like HicB family nuclease
VTQGATEEEALKNINEVVQIIKDELREDGKPLP